MTNAPRESAGVRRILAYLNSLPETYAEKMDSHGRKRVDIFGSYKGRTLVLEAKRPGKNSTRAQLAYMRRWARVGAITGTVRSPEEAKALLESASPFPESGSEQTP